ncbi:MAG: hypothetical protein ABW031_02930, partial [Methyloceanibacter sp.]
TEALDRMKSKDGVRVEQMPQAVLSALRSAWDEVAKEEGDSDYFFRTVLQDLAKFSEAAQKESAPEPSPAPPTVRGSGAAAETKPSP